jgi:hypothetical protein
VERSSSPPVHNGSERKQRPWKGRSITPQQCDSVQIPAFFEHLTVESLDGAAQILLKGGSASMFN